MKLRSFHFCRLTGVLALCFAGSALAQPPNGAPAGAPPPGPVGDRPLVKDFDKDGDKRLNAEERKAAREFLTQQPAGRGVRALRAGATPAPEPGPKLTPAAVKSYGKEPLYDMKTLRTLFLEFEDPDWEKELVAFYHTDVNVPAKLTVDGKTYRDVGVHFRGASSYFTVPEGRKHSLNISMDYADKDQSLGGYRTLNLLNAHIDPTFLRTLLNHQIAREYLPAPKVNYMRVVINGESWGVYVNSQQYNADFLNEWFHTTKGARWKVQGSPRGQGNLSYIGDDPEPYKRIYWIKSKDDPKAWADLIKLCRTLTETPLEKLEQALEPMLDIDNTLRFLAIDKALINNDGYWIRTSDYNIYQDLKGRFHLIPHDANETLREPEGPTASQGAKLDLFAGAEDPKKVLLNRFLAVPSLRARYLGYVRDIAENWIDWNKIGPMAQQYQALIAADVKTDTHKLYTMEAFTQGLTQDAPEPAAAPAPAGPGGPPPGAGRGGPGGPPGPSMSLKTFFEQRRAYILSLPEVQKVARK